MNIGMSGNWTCCILPGLRFSRRTSLLTANFLTKLFMSISSAYKALSSTSVSLSASLFPHVNSHAFLVSSDAALAPRADSVDISLAPDAERAPKSWRLDLLARQSGWTDCRGLNGG